jgi:hypothetical protein
MYPPDKYRIELLHRRDWLLTIEEMTGVDGRGRKSHGQHKYFNKDTYEMMQVAGLFRKMYQSDMILIDYNQI